MLRPTRLTAAHGPITSTRHSLPRSAISASSADLSSEFAAGSSDTVTLVSDVDTRSTDKPCCLNTANAVGEEADRVPHPDGLHRDERDVLLDRDRLHLRRDVAAVRGDDGAFELRRLRRVDVQRNAVLLDRHDAAGMQNLRAAAGDFLRLVVFECAQQPRGRHRARVRAEHARHVGPDLQPARLQLRREVAGRSIGAAAPEQHGIAVLVARDEALRDPDRAGRRPALLQFRIGIVGARRREIGRAHAGVAPLLGLDDRARIDPLHVETLRRRGMRRRDASPSTRLAPARGRAGARSPRRPARCRRRSVADA